MEQGLAVSRISSDVLQEIDWTIEDMPNEDMRLVAEICGVEVALTLIRNFSGMSLYIPKINMSRVLRNHIDEYSGYSINELSQMFGLSKRNVHEILKGPGNSNGD